MSWRVIEAHRLREPSGKSTTGTETMKQLHAVLFCVCLLASVGVGAAELRTDQPSFDAFPVKERFAGKPARPRLASKQDREFKSALENAAKQEPNFAGHYILTNIGCGASCLMTSVIDAKSGHVYWLPFTLCCWEQAIEEPVAFRLDSDLIILRGRKNERENGTWAIRFVGGKFQPVSTIKH
jgi:hypothetical protein